MSRSSAQIRGDLKTCITTGLAFGAACTAWVGVTTQFGSIGGLSVAVSFWSASAFYLVGGLVAGTIVGLLRPLTANLLGRMFVGFVVMIPVGLMCQSVLGHRVALDQDTVSLTLIAAAILGPLYGAATMARDS